MEEKKEPEVILRPRDNRRIAYTFRSRWYSFTLQSDKFNPSQDVHRLAHNGVLDVTSPEDHLIPVFQWLEGKPLSN